MRSRPQVAHARQGARAEPHLPRLPVAIRKHTKDRYACYVLNTMLGGSMSSRLFQNIREKRGLAYAVSGPQRLRIATPAAFTIYAGCAIEALARSSISHPERIEGAQAVNRFRAKSCGERRII